MNNKAAIGIVGCVIVLLLLFVSWYSTHDWETQRVEPKRYSTEAEATAKLAELSSAKTEDCYVILSFQYSIEALPQVANQASESWSLVGYAANVHGLYGSAVFMRKRCK